MAKIIEKEKIMPKITNVLKDGTKIADLTGHIVRKNDAAGVYAVADRINAGAMKRRKECEEWQRMIR